MSYPPREHICCNLCGAQEADLIYQGPDRMLGHPGSFPLVQCRRCGLIYQSPRPIDMAPYYAGHYLPFEHRPRRRLLPRRQSAPAATAVGAAGGYYNLLQLTTSRSSGRILDVGCATGDFLVAMDSAGWQVAGCDLDPAAIARAKERLPAAQRDQVVAGPLETAGFAAESFDVVTLWHSIEHLPDPARMLREVHRILHPAGLLIVQTPAWLSLESQLWKGYWSGFDCPRHLFIFSARTLTCMLHKAGFAVGRSLPQTSYYIWIMSVLFFLQQWLPPAAIGWLYRRLNSGPAFLYCSPFFKVIDSSGQGSHLTFVASKRP